jgi:hypothetical protein
MVRGNKFFIKSTHVGELKSEKQTFCGKLKTNLYKPHYYVAFFFLFLLLAYAHNTLSGQLEWATRLYH